MKKTVGILSFVAPHARLRSGDDKRRLLVEADLANALRARRFEVVSGGAPFPEEDWLAATPSMARRHVHTFIDFDPGCVVFNVTSGGETAAAVECARYLERELKGPCRLIVWADPRHGTGVAERVVSVAGGLSRHGFPNRPWMIGSGAADDLTGLVADIEFLTRRHAASKSVQDVIHRLKRQRVLAFGSTLSRRDHDALDPSSAMQTFGVGVDVCTEGVLHERIESLMQVVAGRFVDPRLEAVRSGPDEGADALRRLAMHFAATDICREREATCATFALHEADSAAPALRWMSAPFGPDGRPKDVIPAAADADFDTVMAQLTLTLLTRQGAWFGRWIDATPEGILVDVHAIGDVGETLTMARFERAAGAVRLVAIEGRIVASREVGQVIAFPAQWPELLVFWPSSHGAFAVGAHGAALVETAHRLDLGFDVILPNGTRHGRRS